MPIFKSSIFRADFDIVADFCVKNSYICGGEELMIFVGLARLSPQKKCKKVKSNKF